MDTCEQVTTVSTYRTTGKKGHWRTYSGATRLAPGLSGTEEATFVAALLKSVTRIQGMFAKPATVVDVTPRAQETALIALLLEKAKEKKRATGTFTQDSDKPLGVSSESKAREEQGRTKQRQKQRAKEAPQKPK